MPALKVWDGTQWKYVAPGFAPGLDGLSDVMLGAAQNREILMHDGTKWINHAVITVSPDAAPPPDPQVDDLWVVEDASPATTPNNFVVTANNPGFTGPGMWVQTNLGPTGEDWTIWIETGD